MGQMDYVATLKYGTEKVEIPIKGAASVEVINPVEMPVIDDLGTALRQAMEADVIGSAPLKELIGPDDLVTIVVSDITRSWMHQGEVLTHLGHYLQDEMQVNLANVTVLIALGTHRKSTPDEMKIIAGEFLYTHSTVVDHDCDGPCVCAGTTARGTQVMVNPLVVGRKVIVVGGTVHHMMAGFGGGRKNLLPGVSSRETIRQNHSRALDPVLPHSDKRVGCGLLADNPINEDMDEAAQLVGAVFSINIVAASNGKHSGLFCGDLFKAWEASCEYQKKAYERWLPKEADVVLVSSGGAPKDMNLYQGCKGMLNGMRAVKPEGEIIWLCKCPEGCGAPDYTAWLKPLQEGRLDEALRADFTIGGFIFYLTVETLQKARCKILTTIDEHICQTMGMEPYKDAESLLGSLDFTGKHVYVLPEGGSVVPMLS